MRHGVCLTAVALAGCAMHGAGSDQPRVIVTPRYAVVRFPVPTTRCAVDRRQDATRVYFWILHLSDGNPGHTVEVWAAVPDSIAENDRSLGPIMPYSKAGVYQAGGEPMMRMAVLDTTARVRAEGDTVLVVRVTASWVVRHAFADHPRTMEMHLCGEDSLRQVKVWYEGGM